MGLTCSLLGHAFDDTDVDRDRSEQGSEVVTVVRELEVCRRCGETRVVSENKEVTSIVEPDDEAGPMAETSDDSGLDAPAGLGGDEPPVEPEPSPAVGDANAAAQAVSEAGTNQESVESEAAPDPSEEDAEILDDGSDEPEREPGQWPGDDASDGQTAESADGPVDLTTEPDSPEETPEPAADAVQDGDYVCPECSFTEPMDASSLRAGDACPSCQRGYLEAR
ncbi:hypothetical protein BRD04_06825 [Halobacteriales archaeon QS_9_67_17]|nr:MAG: hypothetical protein BRD04_06825 [Halobacteriales archaeon QS_9_67_17]